MCSADEQSRCQQGGKLSFEIKPANPFWNLPIVIEISSLLSTQLNDTSIKLWKAFHLSRIARPPSEAQKRRSEEAA
jgi:hypothetical protein